MTRQYKSPSIPDLPENVEPGVRQVLDAIRETVEVREGRLGTNLDRAVTMRDLVNLGLITENQVP